jgi:spore maturation protein CgeB
MKPRIAFFGSSLVSAYWNGAATYYRGIVRALHDRGYHVTFYEPDAYDRQQHRDIPDPDWAQVVVYQADDAGVHHALEQARSADIVIKTSGVGVFDDLLELAVLEYKAQHAIAIFWDVDAPATLDRLERDPGDPFRSLIPQYDMVLTYGGGSPVVEAYRRVGARLCVPIYNALDPSTHYSSEPDSRFAADLGFLGNRLPDREHRVEEFFIRAARLLPSRTFLLGGNGWKDKPLPMNVHYVGHVYTREHNAFNSTPTILLNINRDSMARYGFSPATRVFEAAGAGACIVTDPWLGVELFLEPEREVLVASSGDEVAAYVAGLDAATARAIGQAAFRRVMSEHTYAHRVLQLEGILGESAAA